MRVNSQKIMGCLAALLLPLSMGHAAGSAVLPEIRAYHSFGSRGSSYSTVAGGLAIQLSVEQRGKARWLHLLGLYSPTETLTHRGKIEQWVFDSHGQGFEIGLYDQKKLFDYFQGANTALRHLEWEEAHLGKEGGKISTDVVHLGWAVGTTLMFLWGIDFASLQTPQGSLFEVQFAFGSRLAF